MKTRLVIIGTLLVLCASVCVAQVPAKKSGLTVTDREAWQKVLQWPVALEEQWRRSRTSNEPEQSGLVFYGLGQGKYLVQIEVHESSYQPRYLFMYFSESSKAPARILKLKTYEGDDDDVNKISTKLVEEVEGIPRFDEAKKQLVLHTKGRGTNDCGSLVRYSITPTRAIPVEARVHACFDDYSLGITDPQRWRRVKRL
ncbi:MAG TPA: hypothetical protein VGQ41_26910 [Pyrinomonadaceae bacterium]|jgi:hypothetical protein|nr:hypothetical protein [Pyrinomonadaceae bacterium]